MKNPKILIIDDEQTIVSSMVYYFVRKGYDAKGFNNPEEAIAALAQNGFDVVVTDLHMDRITGFEIIELVRKKFPEVLIIAMSGKYTRHDIEGLDVNYFFEKPFLFKDLEDVIKERFMATS